jgi:hypothetical protein
MEQVRNVRNPDTGRKGWHPGSRCQWGTRAARAEEGSRLRDPPVGERMEWGAHGVRLTGRPRVSARESKLGRPAVTCGRTTWKWAEETKKRPRYKFAHFFSFLFSFSDFYFSLVQFQIKPKFELQTFTFICTNKTSAWCALIYLFSYLIYYCYFI